MLIRLLEGVLRHAAIMKILVTGGFFCHHAG
jgi:hypothetical protein